MKKLRKGAYCTDIHFGKKANSQLHNEDCLRFLDWFCAKAKEEGCDYVAFLGDWNENRSALNIATLNYSYQGAKKLNNIGVPVYFVVGNHDLYHRFSRDVHSIIPFSEFTNFVVIDQPIVVEEIHGKALFCPYMFHDEYPTLTKYFNIPFWAGHFEFSGFQVTGYNVVMQGGPNPDDFETGPKHIVSGHFHKRQVSKNIVYMGNCFPMDYNDAGDNARGMMIYDHKDDEMMFHDWEECPKYIKTTLSNILDESITLEPSSRVKCEVDIPLTFEESTSIRQTFVEKYQLREFVMEESPELKTVLSDTEVSLELGSDKLASVDDLVMLMLDNIESDHIDSNLLKEIYADLK